MDYKIIDTAKYKALLANIRDLGSVAVAFSGGVDSSFLAYVAYEALGDKAIAITLDSPYIPRWELQEARELAASIGIQHRIIRVEQIPETIVNNPSDRCYLCKKIIFKSIIDTAKQMGYDHVLDGSNVDDTKDYRPGLIALEELEVNSPLLEMGWTKEEIRQSSKAIQLETHDKPAYACLLTRIPYNDKITQEMLVRIEESEVYMISIGFRAVRVRVHGELARIEVARHDRKKLFEEDLLDQISEMLKSFGFKYVTIDASGYMMGSFNQDISK